MITRPRRFLVAAFAIALAAVVLHDRCAEELVGKGDAALSSGNAAGARILYQRALWFRPSSSTAQQRLVFSDLEEGSEAYLREAMRISSEVLEREPENLAVLTDRGLCALRLGDDRAAEDALYAAGKLSHDAKLLYLSALAAHRNGENVDIRMYETHHAGAGRRA